MPGQWYPVPTPGASTAKEPTELVKRFYGGSWPNLGEFMVLKSEKDLRYHCFAWSIRYTDRWFDGGSRNEMVRLCKLSFPRYIRGIMPDRGIKLQRRPLLLHSLCHCRSRSRHLRYPRRPGWDPHPNPRIGGMKKNTRALVRHAHRIDAARDPPSCSSKMADLALLQHDRQALEDYRGFAAKPLVAYGVIYGHFKRHPEHPIFPGKEANASKMPPRPPGMIELEFPGQYPAGHPAPEADPAPVPILRQPPSTLGRPDREDHTVVASGSGNNSRRDNRPLQW